MKTINRNQTINTNNTIVNESNIIKFNNIMEKESTKLFLLLIEQAIYLLAVYSIQEYFNIGFINLYIFLLAVQHVLLQISLLFLKNDKIHNYVQNKIQYIKNNVKVKSKLYMTYLTIMAILVLLKVIF